MSAAKSNTLRRLVRRLNADEHGDEAEALKLVDVLMREYAFTRHPLTKDAEQFSDDLRRLVADWMCTPNARPHAEARSADSVQADVGTSGGAA
jgi:hypothetical protein